MLNDRTNNRFLNFCLVELQYNEGQILLYLSLASLLTHPLTCVSWRTQLMTNELRKDMYTSLIIEVK